MEVGEPFDIPKEICEMYLNGDKKKAVADLMKLIEKVPIFYFFKIFNLYV